MPRYRQASNVRRHTYSIHSRLETIFHRWTRSDRGRIHASSKGSWTASLGYFVIALSYKLCYNGFVMQAMFIGLPLPKQPLAQEEQCRSCYLVSSNSRG